MIICTFKGDVIFFIISYVLIVGWKIKFSFTKKFSALSKGSSFMNNFDKKCHIKGRSTYSVDKATYSDCS